MRAAMSERAQRLSLFMGLALTNQARENFVPGDKTVPVQDL